MTGIRSSWILAQSTAGRRDEILEPAYARIEQKYITVARRTVESALTSEDRRSFIGTDFGEYESRSLLRLIDFAMENVATRKNAALLSAIHELELDLSHFMERRTMRRALPAEIDGL